MTILRILLCASLAVLSAGASRTALAETPADERDVKATYLFRFTQFVEWPDGSFADAHAPFVLGVLGQDPFGTALNEVIAGEVVRNRTLVVHRFKKVEEVTVCHVLFVSGSERANYARIFAALKGRPVLTVGDTPEFAARGGIIGFASERNHILLEVNLGAARASGLSLSSNLLRSSRLVQEGAQ